MLWKKEGKWVINGLRNRQKSQSKRISLVLSIAFVALFIILTGISIVFTILAYPDITPQDGTKYIDFFSTQISSSYGMNIPCTILIQLITTIGGVFFGIRIDQWITEKEELEKLSDLWKRVNLFLISLKSGISQGESISKLSEYKIHWDAIQRADEVATKLMQGDDRYIDISFAFSFLAYYNESWQKFDTIHIWELNSSTQTKQRIREWKALIQTLISYTEGKIT